MFRVRIRTPRVRPPTTMVLTRGIIMLDVLIGVEDPRRVRWSFPSVVGPGIVRAWRRRAVVQGQGGAAAAQQRRSTVPAPDSPHGDGSRRVTALTI
jgi:hypothetical protein